MSKVYWRNKGKEALEHVKRETRSNEELRKFDTDAGNFSWEKKEGSVVDLVRLLEKAVGSETRRGQGESSSRHRH